MTILVADDEILVRIGLKKVLDSYCRGYDVIEASNGDEALAKFQRYSPSLVFVDINMPVMDGLKFIEKAKQLKATAKFVILTCYSDFHFLREAIKLGVSDYIIKTSLNNDELIKMATEAEKELEGQCNEEIERNESHNSKEVLIREELRNLLKGRECDVGQISDYLSEKNITPPFDLMLISEKRLFKVFHKEINTLACSIVSMLYEFVNEYGNGVVVEGVRESYILLMHFNKLDATHSEQAVIDEFCSRLVSSLKNYFNKEFTIGIFRDATLGDMPYAVSKAGEAQNLGFYDSAPGYYYYTTEVPALDFDNLSEHLRTEIGSALNASEYKKISSLLDEFAKQLKECRTVHIEKVVNCLCEVLFLIKRYVEFKYPDKKNKIIEEETDYTYFFDKGNVYQIVLTLKQIVAKLYGLLSDSKSCYYDEIICKAKEYIESHIEEEISLSNVALYVNLNPSHFSKIFKDMADPNFIKYCINIKIEKAKAYINEGSKAFVAASNVGYNNYLK